MSMFETGTSSAVRAFHVMPDAPPPENERHAHDYRIEVVAGRRALDERGMVIDLDVLNAAMADLAASLDGSDLDDFRPEGIEGVTVELFAQHVHDRLSAQLAKAGVEDLTVRIWESDTEFGGYRGPITSA
jgi:6-pyruvoyltetrahydropterin/6-carboxytetrahydropterin synthase